MKNCYLSKTFLYRKERDMQTIVSIVMALFFWSGLYVNAISVQDKKPTLYILLGSTRDGRSSDKIAQVLHKLAKDKKEVLFEIVDIKEWRLPFLYEPVAPVKGCSNDTYIKAWSEKIKHADGFIFVVPEYNSSFPGVFKNALDVLYNEWTQKPVLLVGYSGGSGGGVNALRHLQEVVKTLQMNVIPQQVTIAQAWQALDEKGQFNDKKIEQALVKAIDELVTRLVS